MPGLVPEGGAMRSGFVVGAVMALMDKKLAGFDAAVAVSASVPILAYFTAGQRKEIVCPEKMPSVKFVTLDRKKQSHH